MLVPEMSDGHRTFLSALKSLHLTAKVTELGFKVTVPDSVVVTTDGRFWKARMEGDSPSTPTAGSTSPKTQHSPA